jgi:DNA-binding MurR/RpiR family transcriptional regulator
MKQRKPAPPADVQGVLDRIRERFDAMSPELRRAARFLADHAADVAVSSMRALASQAGVKPPTMVRLAKTLEFPGWDELRAVFITPLREPVTYAPRAMAIVRERHGEHLAGAIFEAQRQDIVKTEAQSAEPLPRVAKLLRTAPHVHVAGFRASHAIAFGFAYLYRLFRSSVTLLDGPGATLEMQLRAVDRGDAVLVVSFAPYSREARIVAESARRAGAKVVAIADSTVAPIALEADETLVFSPSSPSFFPSIVGGISLAESLLAVVVSQEGRGVVRRIEAAERQLIDSGSYEIS